MEDERQSRGEPLFLALTRPPIMPLLGLPHGLALFFIVAGAETVIFTKGFIALIALVPLWAAATLYVRNDWNAMRVLGVCSCAAKSNRLMSIVGAAPRCRRSRCDQRRPGASFHDPMV